MYIYIYTYIFSYIFFYWVGGMDKKWKKSNVPYLIIFTVVVVAEDDVGLLGGLLHPVLVHTLLTSLIIQ